MSRSILIQLARDSIQEVLEAKRSIDKNALLELHPLLNEKISTTINLYIDSELRGSATTKLPSFTLLEDIIRNAKVSAFEDKNFNPITTSQYLNCEIEILITTEDGVISERDPAILKTSTFTFE